MLNENTSEQIGQLLDSQAADLAEMNVVLSAPAEEKAAPTPLDNALTIGMVGLLAAAVVVAVICKAISKKKKAAAAAAPAEAPAPLELPTAPGTAGQLKLHDVDPKTAAMLMAIVADKLKKPLNELRFTSIKEVK